MKSLLFVFLLLFSGCLKEKTTIVNSSSNNNNIIINTLIADRHATLNDTIIMRSGETVEVDSVNFIFKFDSVINDSRCPTGWRCNREGEASILILYSDGRDTLYTPSSWPSTAIHNGFKTTLIDLNPYPKTWAYLIPKDSISAEIVVTRN